MRTFAVTLHFFSATRGEEADAVLFGFGWSQDPRGRRRSSPARGSYVDGKAGTHVRGTILGRAGRDVLGGARGTALGVGAERFEERCHDSRGFFFELFSCCLSDVRLAKKKAPG